MNEKVRSVVVRHAYPDDSTFSLHNPEPRITTPKEGHLEYITPENGSRQP
jgi:hypothetical protein